MAEYATNLRWVITYNNKRGMRELAHSQQARHTFATREAADSWLAEMHLNTAAIAQVYGSQPDFQVRRVSCHASGDPKGRYI